MSSRAARPAVVSEEGQAAFERQAHAMRLDPAAAWVGDYVDRSWDELVPIVEALRLDLGGREVLEFGCNVGASAIVFAQLGARVQGVDVAPDWVELARLNAERHGHAEIELRCVHDTRALPYADAQFDLVICNSVLEYVNPGLLTRVQREIDRVLRPGGIVLVASTSSRLWPREIHSGRWGVNYLPAVFDRVVGRRLQRGVWPWVARYGFGPGYVNLDGSAGDSAYLRSKQVGGREPGRFVTLRAVARLIRVPPGLLAPNVFCALRKPGGAR